jgi:phosphatidylserine/phosphatidylglycerophosphate/cardiolipin synthase-like enzyme
VVLAAARAAMDAWLRGIALPLADGDPEAATWARTWAAALVALPRLHGALRSPGARPVATAPVRVVDTMPRIDDGGAPITAALETLIAAAQHEVVLVNPYVVLLRSFAETLARAARRGVAITIVTNSPVSSDNALSQRLFQEQWPRLLAHVPGLRLFASGERTLHGKYAVVDGQVAFVGSENLDPLSMTVLGEIAVAIASPDVARVLADGPRRALDGAGPVLHEYRIARDASGAPLLDDDGLPRVAFGPRDHADPDAWTRLSWRWRILGYLAGPPLLPPLF